MLLLLVVFKSNLISAQNLQGLDPIDTTKVYQVALNDGTIFMGNILEKDSVLIVMKTNSIPRLELPISKIKYCKSLENTTLKNGTYWFANPHASRYLFGPSAINLKKGEKYYQNTWLFLNSFNVGVTDHFSIGGSIEMLTTLTSLANGDFSPTILLTPKIGYQVADKIHAGGGLLYANILGEGSAGIAYGIATVGSYDNNFSAGLGWGFFNGSFSEKPILTFSGMRRVSSKVAFVSENWLIPSDPKYTGYNYYGLFSYGLRFFSENMAVDVAFINNRDLADLFVIGVPFLSFTWKF